MENLIHGTRALLRVLFDGLMEPNEFVDDCIDHARTLHPSDLKADAPVLISIFAMFCSLSRPIERQHFGDSLQEILEELTCALENQSLEEINDMHRHCLRDACRTLDSMGLTNARMITKAREIQSDRLLPEIEFHFP